MSGIGESFRIDAREADRRLDFLLSHHLRISRLRTRQLLESGAVHVDGRVCRRKGMRLGVGTVVEVFGLAETVVPRPLAVADLGLNVLGEAQDWIAVDKPAGWPVHPLQREENTTVLNALLALRPEIEGVGEGGLRSGVVHRLDVDTSGVLLFAKTQCGWERLRERFSSHRIDKVYRALVAGHPPEHGEVELDLLITRHRPARVRVIEEAFRRGSASGGLRRCGLRWRRRESYADASLVEVRPRTGFLHQIRVSFAHLGHPLLGDPVYADPETAKAAPRHMLHASRLCVDDIDVHSEDPPDLSVVRRRYSS